MVNLDLCIDTLKQYFGQPFFILPARNGLRKFDGAMYHWHLVFTSSTQQKGSEKTRLPVFSLSPAFLPYPHAARLQREMRKPNGEFGTIMSLAEFRTVWSKYFWAASRYLFREYSIAKLSEGRVIIPLKFFINKKSLHFF